MLLATALLASCGTAPPAAPESQAAGPTSELSRYLPLEHDTVLAFDTTIEESGETGVLMLRVARKSGNLVELGVGGRVQRLELLPGAIRNLDGGFLLKAPLTVGATWPGMAGIVRVTTTDKRVEVPAGRFEGCVETVEEKTLPGGFKRITTDFCPGVGIVVLDVEAAAGADQARETARLRSRSKRVDLMVEVPK
ncbi:MAG: hypothetical protein OZ921_14790 [Sorangiineae bacterium]|nr:hypothetical protein [Polyangiaceae bacterium]MEB2323776.1 hypothetical protein [Sorangiineae bacterium]